MNTGSAVDRSPCFTHTNFQSLRLQTPKTPPAVAFARYPSARRVSRCRGSRLHHWVAGSSVAQAESSSLSYGWIVHLRLLSTPPLGNAVTFSYELESVWLGKDFHLSIHVRLQAHHPASRRRSYSWLQAGERIPEEDFHLSDHTRFQAHETGRPRPARKKRREGAASPMFCRPRRTRP